jgi:AcrR family transcriptional regulator
MAGGRIDIAGIRREQIVEAAIAVISEQGLQNLSLSEIEKKAGMSRGQLTYYFPTKEEILLAVFDRTVQMMCQHTDKPAEGDWRALTRHVLEAILAEPPAHPEFGCLQYTFLSQVAHREDFRQRLANLYEDWRVRTAEDLADDLARRKGRSYSPRTMASFVQAIFHGVALQRTADPAAFDRAEMIALCMDVLETYLRPAAANLRSPRNSSTVSSHVARPLRVKSAASKRVSS